MLGSGSETRAQQVRTKFVSAGQQPLRSVLPEVTTEPQPSAKPTMEPTRIAVPTAGSGKFRVAEGSSERAGAGRLTSYRVEVERELPWKPADVAAVVDSTLADGRGWIGAGHAFQRLPGAQLRVLVATPKTVDRLCAPLQTRGEVSCRKGNLVVLNAKPWDEGIPAYKEVADYRRYLINHEVGHALGYNHRTCPAAGQPAPVMQQQSISMQSCRPNTWPTDTELEQHR